MTATLPLSDPTGMESETQFANLEQRQTEFSERCTHRETYLIITSVFSRFFPR